MEIFILSFFVMLAIITAMSVGVIFQNKPIKGSCGGIAALGLDTSCEICGGNPQKCEEYEQMGSEHPELFYDASNPKE